MKDFEKNLNRLEELSEEIKDTGISLEQALKDFEEGIKLAKSLEKDIDSIERKVQILMKDEEQNEDGNTKAPELGLFDTSQEITGTRA
jgi:exodeoxyribonuclease VII small subunit